MTGNSIGWLIVIGIFLSSYYFLVLRSMADGEYDSRRKFLCDLIPFGALLRFISKIPLLFIELIHDAVNQFKMLE